VAKDRLAGPAQIFRVVITGGSEWTLITKKVPYVERYSRFLDPARQGRERVDKKST
jgi:hypothetical protein